MNTIQKSLVLAGVLSVSALFNVVSAQEAPVAVDSVDNVLTGHANELAANPERPALSKSGNAGVERLKGLMDTISSGKTGDLSPEVKQAVNSGKESAEVSADLIHRADSAMVEFGTKHAELWEQAAKEAYVAALPPRDRARGAEMLLGDGTYSGAQGKLYIFVSRSMPTAVLRAYAMDALHLGATLVTRGIRKGNTIREYVMEAMDDFNSVEGLTLASLEMNPNLYDMFDVTVVPAIVWTNKVGLDDIGSGCTDLPEGTPVPQITLDGPNDTKITMPAPKCAPQPESSYYKITGTVALPYALDKFEEAGLDTAVVEKYRQALAARHQDVFDGTVQPSLGNQVVPIAEGMTVASYPRPLLLEWRERMKHENVQKTPYGPAFSFDEGDDPAYRQQLKELINRGLGEGV